MSTQTALGHSFPTPCKRCGGALYRQVDYCPYCGAAQPLETDPPLRTGSSGSRASATNQAARRLDADPALSNEANSIAVSNHHPEVNRAEVALRTSLVSSELPIPPIDEPSYRRNRIKITTRQVLYAILAVVVIGLAYVAYALFSDTSDSEDSDVDQTSISNQDARTSTGTIAPFSAGQTTHSSGTTQPAAPGNSVGAANTTPVTSTAPSAPPIAVAPVKPATPQFRDAALALQAARLALNANDLSMAQTALASAQALQPGNADAQTMSSELRPLVVRRDSALQAAQACVAQQSWACAHQHANEALMIDSGNDTAKLILERVIRETGWTPLKTNASTKAVAQGKPSVQTPAAPTSQRAQLQTPPPSGMPANGNAVATAPRVSAADNPATPGTTGADANSVDARERAIKDSGWSHTSSNGAKASAANSPSQ
jgi:hypothetical protein